MNVCKKRRGYGSTCSAFGCYNKVGTNLLSTVRMFKFPRDKERRMEWEAAVGRKNWKPNDSSVLCNRHFITGQRSDDPQHPDYIPSKFDHKEECEDKEDKKMERFERSKKRKIMSDITTSAVEKKNVYTMTDLSLKDIVKMELSAQDYEEKVVGLQKSAQDYEEKIESVQKSARKSLADKILKNKKAFKFYTKLPNLVFFYGLLRFLMANWKPNVKTSLAHADQLLLVMMKLRIGLLNEDLAHRFSISISTVSCSFREWIKRMGEALSSFISKPSKRVLQSHLPQCFKDANLKQVTCIVDCSEIFIQKPFNLDARAHTYSNYKHHNTVKFLISITPSGSIDFISKLYGGRTSDKEITNLCGFLDQINCNDVILADRGFRVEELVGLKGARVIVPAFTKNKNQLPGKEVMKSRIISRVRVHVERQIGRLKSYGILKTTWPITYFNRVNDDSCTGDNILIAIAALCNISRPRLIS